MELVQSDWMALDLVEESGVPSRIEPIRVGNVLDLGRDLHRYVIVQSEDVEALQLAGKADERPKVGDQRRVDVKASAQMVLESPLEICESARVLAPWSA